MRRLSPKKAHRCRIQAQRKHIFFVSIVVSLLFIAVGHFLLEFEAGSIDDDLDGIFRAVLRDEAVQRINQLGKISDDNNYLERTFLSPGSLRAGELIISWMQEAGLQTWVDQMGNVHGRTEVVNATIETLLIGSHLDTVVDGGKYDGSLGIICAISALKVLNIQGKQGMLKRAVEVIAFSDEEGVRFQSTFLGSAAVAGILPASALKLADKSGVTIQDVLRQNSFKATDESLIQVKYDQHMIWGYVEVHMEQGPVLEALNYPLGIVRGIAGQTRLMVRISGSQGHAGTVPMLMRQDAMVAAAELVVALDTLCKHPEQVLDHDEQSNCHNKESFIGLVCTVGEVHLWPGASNVIPGQVNFTVDIRAIDDKAREAIVSAFYSEVDRTCDNRMVNFTIERKHNAEAVHSDPELTLQLKQAVQSAMRKFSSTTRGEVPILMSGAGHDAMAMSHLTKVGMLFVRCRGGISHSPEEYVMEDDVWVAGLALYNFIDQQLVSKQMTQ